MELSPADKQWCVQNAHYLTCGTATLDRNLNTFQDVADAIWAAHVRLYSQQIVSLPELRSIAAVFESYIVAKIDV